MQLSILSRVWCPHGLMSCAVRISATLALKVFLMGLESCQRSGASFEILVKRTHFAGLLIASTEPSVKMTNEIPRSTNDYE